MDAVWIAAAALVAGMLVGAAIVARLRPDRGAALLDAAGALARTTAERDAERGRAAGLEADLASIRAAIDGYRDKQIAQERELATLREQNRGLAEKLATREADRDAQAERFRLLAAEALDLMGRKLTAESEARLDPLLAPLRERLGEFQKRIEETYSAEARERIALEKQIEATLRTSQTVGAQADALARALRGQAQLRGQLGETLLERVLQAAGLVRGTSYVLQGEGLGLRDEAGGLQKPDVIVHLPDGKCIVIDSKLALNDFADWAAAEDEDVRARSRAAFVAAVRRHVADLGAKRYQDNAALRAPEFVLLYMPFEHALAMAMGADPDLFAAAWKQRVALVGPNTLMATLHVVERIWRYETNRQNAEAIALEAGKLYDQLVAASEQLGAVGSAIRKAGEAHEEAMKRMFTGNGNIARRAAELKRLGVRSRKELPPAIVAMDAAIGEGAA